MRRKWAVPVGIALVAMLMGTWAVAAQAAAPAAEKPKKADKGISDEVIQKVTAAMPAKPTVKPAQPRKIIIFTMTKGFRHSSIPLAAKTFEIMGAVTGAWQAVQTDDVALVTAEKLKPFDAIIWDQCTGDPFTDEASKAALLGFVKDGKGIVGVHAATDCFYKWADFGEMMGGYFKGHPFRKISVKLDDPTHPLNAAFAGKGFEISDEIYTFKEPYSRDKLRILLSIDWENANLKGGNRDDNDYALSWIREYGKGRVFYCAFGHDDAIFWNKAVLQHYLDGIQYALGDLKADATPTSRLSPAPTPARGPDFKPKAAAEPAVLKIYAAPLAGAAAAPAGSGLKPDAQGWITLFDGKNLDAWQKPAADKWKVQDGVLTWEKGCGNLWTKDKFGDFILDLEIKVTKGSNSGVFLRSAEGEKNWLHGSFEIQVSDSFGDRKPGKHDFGSLYDCLAPSAAAEKPVGEWNHMVITFKGNSLKITLNDKPTMDADLNKWTEAGMNPDGSKNKFKTAYKDMVKVGYLGLQDHGTAVWYRNVKVKPLGG